MKLYHGSSHKFNKIPKSQAQAGGGLDVPASELQNGIYLTPKYEFALAVAGMPNGAMHTDEVARSIQYEKPELFDPEKEVYVYEVDSERIPSEGNLVTVDDLQYVVLGVDELAPSHMTIHKAGEVEQYYELKNWRRAESDIGDEMRLR